MTQIVGEGLAILLGIGIDTGAYYISRLMVGLVADRVVVRHGLCAARKSCKTPREVGN